MNKAEEFLKGLSEHSLVFELSIEPEYTEKQLLIFAEMYHKSEVKKINIDDVSNQRELLIAFLEMNNWLSLEDEKNAKGVVDCYLKAINCC